MPHKGVPRKVYLVTTQGTKEVFRVFPLTPKMADIHELDMRERTHLREENDRRYRPLAYILRARQNSWEG